MDMKKKRLVSAIETAISISTEETFEALLPERKRPIGKYGRLHREYLKLNYPAFFEEMIRSNVSAKYCYAAHESRLHQNDRCKRFALCLVLTVRFRSLAPWGKLFQLFI